MDLELLPGCNLSDFGDRSGRTQRTSMVFPLKFVNNSVFLSVMETGIFACFYGLSFGFPQAFMVLFMAQFCVIRFQRIFTSKFLHGLVCFDSISQASTWDFFFLIFEICGLYYFLFFFFSFPYGICISSFSLFSFTQ